MAPATFSGTSSTWTFKRPRGNWNNFQLRSSPDPYFILWQERTIPLVVRHGNIVDTWSWSRVGPFRFHSIWFVKYWYWYKYFPIFCNVSVKENPFYLICTGFAFVGYIASHSLRIRFYPYMFYYYVCLYKIYLIEILNQTNGNNLPF